LRRMAFPKANLYEGTGMEAAMTKAEGCKQRKLKPATGGPKVGPFDAQDELKPHPLRKSEKTIMRRRRCGG